MKRKLILAVVAAAAAFGSLFLVQSVAAGGPALSKRQSVQSLSAVESLGGGPVVITRETVQNLPVGESLILKPQSGLVYLLDYSKGPINLVRIAIQGPRGDVMGAREWAYGQEMRGLFGNNSELALAVSAEDFGTLTAEQIELLETFGTYRIVADESECPKNCVCKYGSSPLGVRYCHRQCEDIPE